MTALTLFAALGLVFLGRMIPEEKDSCAFKLMCYVGGGMLLLKFVHLLIWGTDGGL